MRFHRGAVLAAVTVVLAVAAVVLLVAGVDVRETTGGLLVTPIRQLHLVGGFLLAGTAAGVAAILTALAAVPALRGAGRRSLPPLPSRPSRTLLPRTIPRSGRRGGRGRPRHDLAGRRPTLVIDVLPA